MDSIGDYKIVTKPGIKDMLQLPTMFDRAVDEDFTIYDKSTRQKIKNRYSLLNLIFARYKPGRMLLLAQQGKKCVGVLLGGYTSDGIGVIYWVYVDPEHRMHGVARKLLSTAEQLFREHQCHKSIVMTEKAQKFYQRIGYIQEAFFKNHWWGKDFSMYSKYI